MAALGEVWDAALAHHRAGRLAEAEQLYRQILATVPDHTDSLHMLGVLAAQTGHPDAGESLIRQAIAKGPALADMHVNLGRVLLQLDRLEEAQATFATALRLTPDHAGALDGLMQLASRQADAADPERQLRRLLAQDPEDARTLLRLGDLLRGRGRMTEADALLRRAQLAAPRWALVRCVRSNLAREQGDFAAARRLIDEAAELEPDGAHIQRDLATLLMAEGRTEAAVAAYRRATAARPDDAHSWLGLALGLLRGGHWAEGFRLYGWRWGNTPFPRRHRDIPRWTGDDLTGRRILAWDEQGAGDTIMALRFLPALQARAAGLVFETPAALTALWPTGSPAAEALGTVVPRGQPLPTVDCQLPLLDLPGVLGVTPETIPWPGPYLAADPPKAAAWAARLGPVDGRLRIGLSWAGNPNHPNDRWRSPRLATLAPLFDLPGTAWYGLQVASGRRDLEGWPPPATFHDLGPEIGGWDDTAAILANLDLLICPDTAIGHLAGAMGRPCWMLLARDNDWRWLEDREDTPWYPSLRLFRQPRQGDWGPVVARLAAEVSRLAAAAPAVSPNSPAAS